MQHVAAELALRPPARSGRAGSGCAACASSSISSASPCNCCEPCSALRRRSSICRCMPAICGLLFRDLGLAALPRRRAGLVADGDERFLHLLLDRELDLALRIFELALLAQHIRLGLLRRRRAFRCWRRGSAASPPAAGRVRRVRRPAPDGPVWPPLRRSWNARPSACVATRSSMASRDFASSCSACLSLASRWPKLFFLVRKLPLEAPLGLRDQRGGERFGQLDRGAAIRADDLWVGHGRGPRIGVAPCIAALESA